MYSEHSYLSAQIRQCAESAGLSKTRARRIADRLASSSPSRQTVARLVAHLALKDPDKYRALARRVAARTTHPILDIADAHEPRIKNAVQYAFARGRQVLRQHLDAHIEKEAHHDD